MGPYCRSILVAMLTFLISTEPAAAAWVTRVTSIGINRVGQPHISYYDATSRNLWHAVKTLGVVHPPINR